MRNWLALACHKVNRLREYGGFWTFAKGCYKRVLFRVLYWVYHFDYWHTAPVEWREYALELCKFVNSLARDRELRSVVEVGCGLGEILGRLKIPARLGFDRSESVLRVARKLHPGIEFVLGSFAEVSVKADILIAVNFIHEIPPEELKQMLLGSAEKAGVKYIVVDRVAYAYYHDFDAILGQGWERTWESQTFPPSRQVLCYQRRGCQNG